MPSLMRVSAEEVAHRQALAAQAEDERYRDLADRLVSGFFEMAAAELLSLSRTEEPDITAITRDIARGG